MATLVLRTVSTRRKLAQMARHTSRSNYRSQQSMSKRLLQSFWTKQSGEISLLRKYTESLKTHECGLMQKLLTGQWRLPVQGEAN